MFGPTDGSETHAMPSGVATVAVVSSVAVERRIVTLLPPRVDAPSHKQWLVMRKADDKDMASSLLPRVARRNGTGGYSYALLSRSSDASDFSWQAVPAECKESHRHIAFSVEGSSDDRRYARMALIEKVLVATKFASPSPLGRGSAAVTATDSTLAQKFSAKRFGDDLDDSDVREDEDVQLKHKNRAEKRVRSDEFVVAEDAEVAAVVASTGGAVRSDSVRAHSGTMGIHAAAGGSTASMPPPSVIVPPVPSDLIANVELFVHKHRGTTKVLAEVYTVIARGLADYNQVRQQSQDARTEWTRVVQSAIRRKLLSMDCSIQGKTVTFAA